MRTFRTAILLMVAGLTGAGTAAAQAPPPAPPPPAAAPAAPPAVEAPAPPAAPPAAPAAAAAPAATPPAPPGNWYDKFSGDAFVDAYGAINWNFPKPQAGTTALRAYDIAQGFALSWIGLNGSYTSDTIGGTISLRFGPSAQVYGLPAVSGSVPPGDNSIGMQNVRQAYATLKPVDKVTLDFGKFDQPFGSEVPDAQLNMEYTRSLLFNLNQPVFFTGLRFDYAASDMFDLKLIAANGWNNTFDNNRGKSFGAQIMLKPADPLVLYLGYMGGPEQPDVALTAGAPVDIPNADDHWRHLVDLVVDFNPTKQWRFLLNGDFDTEANLSDGPTATTTHTATWYGANLAVRYQVSDPFQITLRGEYFHDEKGDIVPPFTDASSAGKTNIESGTLTLGYTIASHLAIMFDNRIDIADSSIFQTGVHPNNAKTQFTSTLGVIASTK
jgi:Putative beta-barrel porin-2, OmpL-like. bbp2